MTNAAEFWDSIINAVDVNSFKIRKKTYEQNNELKQSSEAITDMMKDNAGGETDTGGGGEATSVGDDEDSGFGEMGDDFSMGPDLSGDSGDTDESSSDSSMGSSGSSGFSGTYTPPKNKNPLSDINGLQQLAGELRDLIDNIDYTLTTLSKVPLKSTVVVNSLVDLKDTVVKVLETAYITDPEETMVRLRLCIEHYRRIISQIPQR